MVILRDSGLANYVVVLDNKVTLNFDLDLKVNQATNYLILHLPSVIVLVAFESIYAMVYIYYGPLVMLLNHFYRILMISRTIRWLLNLQ